VIAPASRPAVGRRSPTVRILGEVALVVVLTLTLAFSWRDGAVRDVDVFAAASSPVDTAPVLVAGRELRPHDSQLSADSTVIPAAPPIPTARPVQLLIPALDVHRAVEGVGVNRSGVLNLPVNAWNAGWYTGGPVPGAPGDAVIEGHAGYPGQPMIFGRPPRLTLITCTGYFDKGTYSYSQRLVLEASYVGPV
jgi:hypothetical protein